MTPEMAGPSLLLPDDLAEAVAHVSRQIAEAMAAPGGAFSRSPPAGYRRGLDFYSTPNLVEMAARGAYIYRRIHGYLPNLLDPRTFTEKVLWAKIFRLMRVPQSGNKLLAGDLLPAEAAKLVAVPKVVWRSLNAKLPPSDSIPPGTYFLKTNHGSGMFRRIEWPLTEPERQRLEREFSGHLRKDYGYAGGEWWYLAFQRGVFLEQSVVERQRGVTWCFYTFRDRFGPIVPYLKTKEEDRAYCLRPDFSPLEWQSDPPCAPWFVLPPAAVRRRMLEAAAAIGRSFSFVRVDLMIGEDEELYLSELTFSPGNGMTRWPHHLNLQLGEIWKHKEEPLAQA